MYTQKELYEEITITDFDNNFCNLYGVNSLNNQKGRHKKLLEQFSLSYGGTGCVRLFSAPGRIEIGGNHTDHNNGRVLAAAINLDSIAVVRATSENIIRVKSAGFIADNVILDDLSVDFLEVGTSASLIRGIAAHFQQLGYAIGGFDACTTSDVLTGSGLSSSAAFEVLICTILNNLYNEGRISPIEIAKISKYVENVYFGKPSGLMDQMASAVGGVVHIDFKDMDAPVIETIDADFEKQGYSVCIVNTGGFHSDLTEEYASIPCEMLSVAKELGSESMRAISMEALIRNAGSIRQKLGDRDLLRAFHFIGENERVNLQVQALKDNVMKKFNRLVIDSGNSSFEYLQNVYSNANIREQGLSVALCLAEQLLHGQGAWRVHGGGFAGTTFNLVPKELLAAFQQTMESVFGGTS